MKKGIIIVLVVFVGLGLGGFLWIKYLGSQATDRGGMENPNVTSIPIQPAEGAKLISCSLTHFGETAESNYSFQIDQKDDEVVLTANYYDEDGNVQEIEEQPIDPTMLDQINALVGSLSLTEERVREDLEPVALDASKQTLTLTWEDGTTGSPSNGYQEVYELIQKEVRSKFSSNATKEGHPVMEIQVEVPMEPIVGETVNTEVLVTTGMRVSDSYWWSDQTEVEKPEETKVDTFEAVGNYYLHIELRPEDGYTVPQVVTGDTNTPLVYQGNFTVNGEAIESVPCEEDGTLKFDWWGKPAN